MNKSFPPQGAFDQCFITAIEGKLRYSSPLLRDLESRFSFLVLDVTSDSVSLKPTRQPDRGGKYPHALPDA